jgi:hypothetical protein
MGVHGKNNGRFVRGVLATDHFLFRGGKGGMHYNAGAPLSGTSGTLNGIVQPWSKLLDTTNGTTYVNENTKASPYWTPMSMSEPGIRGWSLSNVSSAADDIKAVSNTDATKEFSTGIKVHGQGIAETDSGYTVAAEEGLGNISTMVTTNEVSHTIALGIGDTTLPFQPDTHGPIVLDVNFTHVSAITTRSTFAGFIGASANALDPVATGASTTITLVLDDLAGMFQDVGLTDGDGIFLPHNKSNEAATIATTATGVDTSTTMAAAATYSRWRVQISAAGVMIAFVNKAQVGTITAALDVDEELAPSFYIESTSAATKSVKVDRFDTWGLRA